MKKLFFLFIFFSFFSSFAQTGRRLEVLFLGDNGHHKPIERVPSLMAALGPKGVNVTYTDDLTDLNPKTLNKYDAVMLYANWDEISPAQEKALLDFVASGKGFLPIHCASYCFRNSPEFVKLVGGQFWRHTMDSITTQTVQPNHPIMQGLKPFTAYDETYLHTKLEADNNVLATREIKADQFKDKPDTKTEPYTWTRTHGKGKVFYTAYGHDDRTWSNPDFQEMLYKAILWSVNDEALAAFNARNPVAFTYREANLPNYEQRPGPQLQQFPLSPEESMKHLQVPVDFNLELFAAEPNVMHPIAITWDEKGRLFVLVTKDYPNERKKEGGSDYILMCEDTDKDGKADKFTKWADGLSIPTGMVFANGGLIVSQAPDMLFLQDTDGDDKADKKKVLFSGFGTGDTHAGPSNLHYGFDNWIWGCVGYSGYKGKFDGADTLNFGQAFFRFLPDGSKMEWMTSTSNNTWGMSFNETNDVFGSTANNSHGWYMAIPHSYFNSKNRVDNGSRSTDTHRDMKPITNKVRQVDAFGGFTAAAGYNFYTARSFPKKYWNNIAFVSEPTGHILHQNSMQKKGTDFFDKESFNLMAGADEWFSPVFAEVGPDGAVWVADWYSFIIQHNPVPKGFQNGTGNAYDTDLRDFTHGRIYRVSAKEAPEYTPLALSIYHPDVLLKALKNDNMFWRMQAQRLLVQRGKTDVKEQLIAILKDQSLDEIGINAPAIHALWTLKGLNAIDNNIIEIGLKHASSDVRKNTLKVMDFTKESVELVLENDLLNDKDPLVVLNALLLFSKSPLDDKAEKVFFERMDKSTEVEDRWLPDAFACVLTANDGKLLKKHLANQTKSAKLNAKPMDMPMNHDHSKMMHEAKAETKAEGIDLLITDIIIDPTNPSARERITVTVNVKNQGKIDLPADKFVSLDMTFEGMGMKVDQLSRNFKEGINAGETVAITKNINGPWVGNISFYTDIIGEYNLGIVLDKGNEINESNEKNNFLSKKINFAAPANMNTYSMERALRSYASVAPVKSLVAAIRNAQTLDAQGKSAVIKAISEGWNYKIKDVKVNPTDKVFLTGLNKTQDAKLTKLLQGWNVIAETKLTGDVKVIRIKAVKEAMKYDLKEFTVKAGQTVELIFENPDAMQHNLVIIKPKTNEKVGTAADKMMMDEKGAEKNYVPALSEVLFSTPLVNPEQSFKLTFKAPNTIGNYPYICTFPGHWRLMNGVMKVVK
ncbi:dehydrogenase [Lacihabitans sp. LS3-19]|uniref:PVC-type heme-binding CxxCH protein n=1 Tax=Lacihabitans sp. LS3-19 TaxID=2487335 RepID=UPI0020CBCE2D|nr:PVC-type heme-binding CxxCH protein [Lacihabitans sp. LS3-19]MCP9769871.1 dehydrogenase [Lacihabitans sp. LS3-19]